MIRKLQHVFALSEKGARDFVKAVMWSFFCNISLMLPVGVVMATLQYLLDTLETGGDPSAKVLVYTGAAAAVFLLLFLFPALPLPCLPSPFSFFCPAVFTLPPLCRGFKLRLRTFGSQKCCF